MCVKVWESHVVCVVCVCVYGCVCEDARDRLKHISVGCVCVCGCVQETHAVCLCLCAADAANGSKCWMRSVSSCIYNSSYFICKYIILCVFRCLVRVHVCACSGCGRLVI